MLSQSGTSNLTLSKCNVAQGRMQDFTAVMKGLSLRQGVIESASGSFQHAGSGEGL